MSRALRLAVGNNCSLAEGPLRADARRRGFLLPSKAAPGISRAAHCVLAGTCGPGCKTGEDTTQLQFFAAAPRAAANQFIFPGLQSAVNRIRHGESSFVQDGAQNAYVRAFQCVLDLAGRGLARIVRTEHENDSIGQVAEQGRFAR